MLCNIAHICIFDPSKASRIQMQLHWDVGNALILSKRYSATKIVASNSNVKYKKLTLFNLISVLSNGCMHYVFHEQSTLPYLMFAYLYRLLFNKNIRVVYDMHDLNEETTSLSYRYIRYLICWLLEFVITKLNICIITVSNGLSHELSKRYLLKNPPRVVYNIPFDYNMLWSHKRYFTSLLYFGQIEPQRISDGLLGKVLKSNFILHLYGSISNNSKVFDELITKYIDSDSIKMMGPYESDNLEFLLQHSHTVIDYSSEVSKNIKYCLPNKLFQSLRYGLICIISSNLVEAKELFSNNSECILIMNDDGKLDEVITRFQYDNHFYYFKKTNQYLDSLYAMSKINYCEVIYQ